MADADLQVLLDPDYKIVRRSENDAQTTTSYYITGHTLGKSKCGWVTVTTADTDETKDTAIRDALAY